MKNYYVYRIFDAKTNEYYIGSRGCKCNPEEDKYMGSPKTWKPNSKNLKKEIIKDGFDSIQTALDFERKLIIENINHPLNRNYAIPHRNITREGLILCKDNNGKSITIDSKDPLFGKKFFGFTKGKVVVVDDNGKTFQISVNDERYLSGKLKHVSTINKGNKHHSFNKKWISNGTQNKIVEKDYKTPKGWYEGSSLKGKRTNASHYGTCWINKEKETLRIHKNDLDKYLSQGWIKGRGKLGKYKKNERKGN